MRGRFKSEVERAASLEAAIVAWETAADRLESQARVGQQGYTRKRAVALVLRQKVSKANAWLDSFYSGGDFMDMPLELLG